MTDNKHKMVATVIASAAVATVGQGQAQAADAAAPATDGNPLNVTIVGGLVLSDFSENSGTAKLGYFSNTDDIGGFGSISVGRAFEAGSPNDWRVTGEITEFLNNHQEYSFSGTTYTSLPILGYGYADYYIGQEADNDADWQHLDFEVGHTTSNGSLDMRIASGLQIMNLRRSSGAQVDVALNYAYGNTNYGLDANVSMRNNLKFLGGGPLLSVEGRAGGVVGLEFAGSVAAVFGQKTETMSYNITAEYDFTDNYDYSLSLGDTDSDWTWLYSAEVSAGISVRPSESVDISAGYRYERIDGVDSAMEDALDAHGPYVKLKASF